VENASWKPSKHDTTIFFGNHKPENSRDMVADLLKSYKAMGCNKSLKVRFVDSHLDLFEENFEAVSIEYVERFSPGNFHHGESGAKASGVPVCWLITAGHLEETTFRQNIAESRPLLFFDYIYIYIHSEL
jgi:hypothetical protein